jgi:hypothetical protein
MIIISLKYGISTLFIFVSSGLEQLEHIPGKMNTSSMLGASAKSESGLETLVDLIASGEANPSITLSSIERVYSLMLHCGSDMFPMNSMKEFPDGSSSFKVSGFTMIFAFSAASNPSVSSGTSCRSLSMMT